MNKKITQKEEIRIAAENSLLYFINLIHPNRMLGAIHEEIITWWQRQGAEHHQLLLLPRDHQKSALVAYRAAWEITKNPDIRILYVSSTANLATKQLKFIKDILTSDRYRFYWPNMVRPEEGKREKWTETEISVDHPKRKLEAVRDPTVFTAGLTTGITGLHCDIAILDDVVVKENAYTNEGRERVRSQYSLLSSIEGADAYEWVVGTRYHPSDLYDELLTTQVDQYDDLGNIIGATPLYEVFERQVENSPQGDGTGEFLWPLQKRYDGKPFGFNRGILAKKRAQYLDRGAFRAQYYNNPNDPGEAPIDDSNFQYYDRAHLERSRGIWFINGKRLNVFAAVDFAFSVSKKADYTAIVVVGVTSNYSYYIMDIARFKTKKISEYFKHILTLHQKWDFRKLRAEVSVAQDVIVEDLKQNYIRTHGLALSIVPFRPTRYMGNKDERVNNILEPRYDNMQIWHYKGGNCQVLEEELVLSRPPHDDVKDCLATCIDMCVAPSRMIEKIRENKHAQYFHNRFGGVS